MLPFKPRAQLSQPAQPARLAQPAHHTNASWPMPPASQRKVRVPHKLIWTWPGHVVSGSPALGLQPTSALVLARKTGDRRLPQYLASAHTSPCAVCCWQKLSTQPQSSQPDKLNTAWVKLFCATFRRLPSTGPRSMLHDVTSSDPGASFPFLKTRVLLARPAQLARPPCTA